MARKPRPVLLAVLVLLAFTYVLTVGLLHLQSGILKFEGIVGVVLGLYIGSHPAANLLDIFIYGGIFGPAYPSRKKAFSWLALNFFTLLAGFAVIVLGATRFTAARP
jgi:hypothetical protein